MDYEEEGMTQKEYEDLKDALSVTVLETVREVLKQTDSIEEARRWVDDKIRELTQAVQTR